MSPVPSGDRAALDWTFGAQLGSNGIASFRVWAPGHERLYLHLEGSKPLPMRALDGGFHGIETSCRPGATYRYGTADGVSVPDPASRLQAPDVHDSSVVVDSASYRWRNTHWRGRPWREAVLYELHVGAMGGYRAVQRELPRLATLGITAIELMPIADFAGSRNWGYDGVLPYAPDTSYGSPDELKTLIDAAHDLGIMVFLDVVYNHFGPDGNYLGVLAPEFFRNDQITPWGPAIDFRHDAVRRYFAENALYWLAEYRFDGLRFDAVHAINDPGWLPEMARFVRSRLPASRQVHLVLENDDNTAAHLRSGFDAQWNDDMHHVLHVLLTRETEGYYSAYADQPTQKLARALAEGFVYQGEASVWRQGAPRGEPSADLPPTAFVFFLQNHDQIGNRAMGERLTALVNDSQALRAAIALQLLCPHIPLLFMGEESGATAPFYYFTDYHDELATAVREGRRREFAGFSAFSDSASRERIPDPNAVATFQAVRLSAPSSDEATQWEAYYAELLRIRHQTIVPFLSGAQSLGAKPFGAGAICAQWRLGNDSLLMLYTNLAAEAAKLPASDSARQDRATLSFESRPGIFHALQDGTIPSCATVATLTNAHGSQP